MQEIELKKLLFAQHKVTKEIASGQGLALCLETICLQVEAILDNAGAKTSILLLQGRHLAHGAAPHLPLTYCEAIDGVEIGQAVGSCGTAAFFSRQVIVSDIENDPLWKDFAPLALSHNLRACWSTPVVSSSGAVLGTFAIYYDVIKVPNQSHLELIEFFTSLVSLAIEKDRASKRERVLNRQLTQTIERLMALTRVMPDMGLIFSEDGTYVDIYGETDQILSNGVDQLIGKKVSDVLPVAVAKGVMETIDRTLHSEDIQLYEYQLNVPKGLLTLEGRCVPIHNYLSADKKKRHVLWMARDITEFKKSQLEIEKLAFYDPLTDLPNRRLLLDRLEIVIKQVKRNRKVAALIFLDLDNFKKVNDNFGHSSGDQLLIDMALRLNETLRDADTLARIGGDEFVILLEGFEHGHESMISEAEKVCDRILDALENEFFVAAQGVRVSASLGISIIEGLDVTADQVLGHADTAMYQAKKAGKGQACLFKSNSDTQ